MGNKTLKINNLTITISLFLGTGLLAEEHRVKCKFLSNEDL